MKRTILIKLSVFLLFFLAGWVYLNKVFASEHQYVNSIERFKSLTDKSNVDVLFIGSSHVFTAVNPHIINTKSKTLSFNLGTDGMRLELSSLVLEEALKYTTPKLVVIEIFRGSVTPMETDASKGFQLRALDFVSNLNPDKWELVNQVYNSTEIPGVYSPFYRNHKNWNSEKYFDLDRRKNFDDDKVLFYDGYFGTRRNISKEERLKYSDFRAKERSRDTSVNYFNKVHLEELNKLVSLSKAHSFELLIQTSPDLKATSINNHFYDQIADFCEQNNLKYLNLNTDYYYDLVDLTTDDFKDSSHLNLQGGEKVSAVVADFINQNYTLPDRSNDPLWKRKIKEHNEKYYGKTVHESTKQIPLTDSLYITSMKIVRAPRNFKVYLEFNDTGNSKNKYKVGVQLYPMPGAEDELHPDSIEKNRNYDSGGADLIDTDSILELTIFSKVENIDRYRFFLYDIKGYNGVIGNPVIIDSN